MNTPQPASTPTAPVDRPVLPLVIDPATMTTALTKGTAAPLTPIVTCLTTYRGHWWIDTGTEWLLITDADLSARLDGDHTRSR